MSSRIVGLDLFLLCKEWRLALRIDRGGNRGGFSTYTTGRRTLFRNLSIMVQIALVTHYDDREIIFIFDPQYLLLKGQDLFEALP